MSTDVPTLEFGSLPRYQPRRFVPDQACLTDLKEIIPLYEQLLNRLINSTEDLEHWLMDRSELDAALDQEGTLIYIRMTCQTDDEERSRDYQHFIQNIIPALKPLGDRLDRKYLDERARYPIDKKRYEIHDRIISANVDLFVPQNVPLQTEEALLSQEYQRVCGAMNVFFEGQERTLPQMAKYLLENDQVLRESAWRVTADRRLQDKEKLEDILDRMLRLRTQIAVNAHCVNFCEYQFRAYHRFDYSPQDCKNYHESIERVVVPVWQEMIKVRKSRLNLKTLRPWDTEVDTSGGSPLKPFDRIEDLGKGTLEIFNRMDKHLGSQFGEMRELGLLDLESRRGKAPGGYQSTLNEARKPFIFMNAVGIHQDVQTLLHEAGHAFHALASQNEPLHMYRHAPMEFCEVASMGMELLAADHLDVFYGKEDLDRAKFSHFEDIIYILVWVAIVDCFQQWIYENPRHSPEQRRLAWLKIHGRFGGDLIDWNGLDQYRGFLWHRQLHIFEAPFYYIEYGIAQLGALQLWQNAQKNMNKTLIAYKNGLSLGRSRPLPELFTAAGIKFDFSEGTIKPLMEAVQKKVSLLAQ